jgi:flagellar biosynthesis protein FliR
MDLTPVLRFGLLLVRPGLVVMLSPGLGGQQIPAMVKIGLTVMTAIALVPSVTLPTIGNSGLALIILKEAAVGLSLAFALQVLVAGAEFAGHLAS